MKADAKDPATLESRGLLKEKFNDIKQHYKALEDKLPAQKVPGQDTPDQVPQYKFEHPRVLNLWKMAQEAGFSEEELRSFEVCFVCN